ncbi:unnamed protein product [Cyprideis torosa]|uniref:Deoxyribodipyrimidine photo-lyase n=1 Tax=Cyprideis torosa TaxID=163714 RepID=A0A7R8W9K4_9CRUS|nr:unnamed protein product [Cyprideis torosa]CAG0884475.1 unnamed protein product [Cyprideis torosa]
MGLYGEILSHILEWDCMARFFLILEWNSVVADFSPLKIALQWIEGVKGALDKMDVPLIQVDAHNVVPVWETSDKQEYAARTIRRKIHDRLKEFGTEFPPLVPHPAKEAAERIDWQALYDWLEVDESIGPVKWATPGTAAGLRVLEEFLTKRMKKYEKRNDPNEEALSNLSPWFHYGQVAPQRAILEVSLSRKANPKAADSFIEEALVRRELSDNFCFYNPRYDSIEGAADWARKTLNDHKNDVREYLYSFEEFEGSRTHDDLWNAAQIQLVREGKMHGFLRMYWAKKILEWTTSPEEALAFAIKLNDKYELDGRDPNGFVGCMWSICGIHDQGWTERPIFGKIRYMNYAGCKRKFDVVKFVNKYGAKAYPYNKGGTRKVAAGGSTSAAASTSRKRASTPAKSTAAKKAKK